MSSLKTDDSNLAELDAAVFVSESEAGLESEVVASPCRFAWKPGCRRPKHAQERSISPVLRSVWIDCRRARGSSISLATRRR